MKDTWFIWMVDREDSHAHDKTESKQHCTKSKYVTNAFIFLHLELVKIFFSCDVVNDEMLSETGVMCSSPTVASLWCALVPVSGLAQASGG